MSQKTNTLDENIKEKARRQLKDALINAFKVFESTLDKLRPSLSKQQATPACWVKVDGLRIDHGDVPEKKREGPQVDAVLHEIREAIQASWTEGAGEAAVEDFVRRVDELGDQVANLKASVEQ